jgi:hypothetical protein
MLTNPIASGKFRGPQLPLMNGSPRVWSLSLSAALLAVAAPTTAPNVAPAQERNSLAFKAAASCIATRTASRERKSHSGIWEHSVYVANRCDRAIELTICYAFSEECITVPAPPAREIEHKLGIRNKPFFEYTVTEH